MRLFGGGSVDDKSGYEVGIFVIVGIVAGALLIALFFWSRSGQQVQENINVHVHQQRTKSGDDLSSEPSAPAPTENTNSDATETPQIPDSSWWDRLKTYFQKPSATAGASEALDQPISVSQPAPQVTSQDSSDEDIASEETQEVVWKHAPRLRGVESGDSVIVRTGSTHIKVEISGVMSETHGADWLLRVPRRKVDALEKIIHEKPKDLKVSVES